MIRQLTGAQRLWLLFAVALLAATIALIAAAWPQRDPSILADLRAAQCRAWLDTPKGQLPDAFPGPGEACYRIGTFVYEHRVAVRTEGEYAAFLRKTAAKRVLVLLALWAAVMALVWALGWSSAKGVGKLQKRRESREQATP
jgi:hypothetical protein